MGRLKEESDLKSQLVTEICNISSCAHWHGGGGGGKPNTTPFIDWCLVLRVEENAGLDVIRKQYHKLALQLHPDKNKHPKAEFAFKLVSEAYECLSQHTKRAEFNLERQSIRRCCTACNNKTTPYANIAAPPPPPATTNTAKRLRSRKSSQGLEELKTMFLEEVRVIENCLRVTKASTKGFPILHSRKEHPIFNPSDYLFQGYPHLRTEFHKNPLMRGEKVGNGMQRKGDSPVFQF